MNLGVPELLILMVIVLLLFGPGRLGNIAGEIGSGIRSFREGLKGDDNKSDKPDNDKGTENLDQSDKPEDVIESEKNNETEAIDNNKEKQ